MTLPLEFVRRGVAEHADATAVYFGDEALTFRAANDASNRRAAAIVEAGLKKGDHVALVYGNSLWTISVDFATMKNGLVRVPLNPRLSLEEHVRMLAEADVHVLVHDASTKERAAELLRAIPGGKALGLGCPAVDGRGPDLLDERYAGAGEPEVPISAADPLMLIYTSGTTGKLKAVIHAHGNFGAIGDNILANLLDPRPGSVMLHAASLIHASGTFVLPYWSRGAASAVLPGFVPKEFAQAIARYRVTETNVVPTMLGMLLSTGALDGVVTSSLQTIIYGASPMPRPILERGIAKLGYIFKQYYGQTEAPLAITVLTKDDHRNPDLWGSCGKPSSDVELRIADEHGVPVQPGEIGEMQLRAPFAMQGYYQADALNVEMWMEGGWLRTRDMARADQNGYIFLVDRRSDMIITGGYNVYPREVEDALLEHPAVAECAVVGAPDPKWVEAVTAFVVLKAGQSATAEELQALARKHLAGYKVPKSVRFVASIPKTAVGKLQRRDLRAQLRAEAEKHTGAAQ
jgi:acyl-CoA synthetase (AMP-forming)/AMP-acid ligase II